jgi:phosphate starvation-inducible protein PhoH
VDFVLFTERDVVRHELVQKIIVAYDQYARRGAPATPPGEAGAG